MIYIKKDTNNPILLQLTSTSVFAEFYFKFINVMTNDVVYFVSTNMSGMIATWDLFELEEDSALLPNPEFIDNAPLCLISGQYEYYVISTNELPIDLDDAKQMDIEDNYVAIGKMVVQILDNKINTIEAISYNDMPI
jgi:hypothetical protein